MLLAATPKLSEGGSLLTSQPTAECDNLAAIQGEMVIEQERIGKTGLVEGAVSMAIRLRSSPRSVVPATPPRPREQR